MPIPKKVMKIIVLLEAIGLILVVLETIDNHYLFGNQLERNPAGEGEYEEKLQLQVEGYKEKQEIVMEVLPEQLTEKEAKKTLKEAEKEIEKEFLGENQSFDNITTQVKMQKNACGGRVKVKWELEEDTLVSEDGTIDRDDLTGSKKLEQATATLSVDEYESVDVISFVIQGPAKGSWEEIVMDVRGQLNQANHRARTKTDIVLPARMEGRELYWKKESSYTGLQMMLLGIVAGAMIYFGQKEEEKSRKEKRKQGLLYDYPAIVSTLSLLLSAGLSTKGAWQRMVQKYERERRMGGLVRPGFEEMLITYREIEGGVGETTAYERFGNRVGLREYRKLSMLLLFNMTKGTMGLAQKMEREEWSAFEERKMRAKRAGEEAGTKLLLPMMMILAVVIMVLIMPAMMQLRI